MRPAFARGNLPTLSNSVRSIAEPELIERESELLELTDMLEEARAGDGRMAIVEGPAGIGKSRLLAELGARADGAGITALCARGEELEQSFAFGVFRQLLERPVEQLDGAERRRVLSGAAKVAAPLLGAA